MTQGIAAIIIELKAELKNFPDIKENIESAVKSIVPSASIRVQYMEGGITPPQVKA